MREKVKVEQYKQQCYSGKVMDLDGFLCRFHFTYAQMGAHFTVHLLGSVDLNIILGWSGNLCTFLDQYVLENPTVLVDLNITPSFALDYPLQ